MPYKVPSFTYVPVYGGDTGLVLKFQEANSQTFVKGDLVLLNAAGDITLAGADPASILGIAQQDATNVTTGHATLSVQVIREGDLYSGHFISSKTFVLTDAGGFFEIVRTAAGNWEVDSAAVAANQRVQVMQSLEFDSEGTLQANAGGPIVFKFLNNAGATTDILQWHLPGS